MSQQSILEKSLQIRNETQEYANTRGRVADVLDDINETKANRTEVTEEIDEAVEALNIGSKMDRPVWDGAVKYYLVKSDAGANNLQEITLSANRVPVWSGSNLADSPVYVSSGRVGIGAASVSEVLEVTGNVKANAVILPVNNTSAIANRLRSDGTYLYHSNSSSVEKRLMYDDGDTLRTLQVEVSTNTTAQESWKGKIILITASCTVTIPATLSDSWSCEIATLANVNLTLAITAPKTWLFGTPPVISEKYVVTIAQRGNTNSIMLFGI